MVAHIATAGFGVAALAYLAVAAVLILGWRGRGLMPLFAVFASIVWAIALGVLHFADQVSLAAVAAADGLRLAGWLALLLGLLAQLAPPLVCRLLLGIALFAVLAMGLLASTPLWSGALGIGWGSGPFMLSGLVGALIGLVLIEQVYRNAPADTRWSLKYLCLGVGAVFAYDLFLFADALVGQRADPAFWAARGYVNALVAPLIAVSAARNPEWSLDVYVSRRFVLHTATLTAAGAYLVVMAGVAYSIEIQGGVWAGTVQAVFLVGSILGLVILICSGRIRARARVFLSKHFYNYRYDYREEWLRFSRTLAAADAGAPDLGVRVIEAVGQVVDSPAGVLWQLRDGRFEPSAHWNMPEPDAADEAADADLPRLLTDTQWILSTDEWRRTPQRYRHLAWPPWLLAMDRVWLLVPLLHHGQLIGFVVLRESRAGRRALNWEDFDLFRIIGCQAASHLVQEASARALAQARQFDAFHRLSAFVLHDLKNLIGQLSMLARNARRHGSNPAFAADAVATIEHAVERMNQLMGQLNGGLQPPSATTFDLASVIGEIARARAASLPVPTVELPEEWITVRADRTRLASVLANLVQNAQEATAMDGTVRITLARDGTGARIEIVDSGSGMSREFVRERLFEPFDSGKGTGGMGIGAFEARTFVRELGGDLRVDSVLGQGTRVAITLPANVAEQRLQRLAGAVS